jgi:uncharacterized glyoxalase superfamily protein PhnB
MDTQAYVVIYTDKLAETRHQYETQFHFAINPNIADGFAVCPIFGDGMQIIYLDAVALNKPITSGLLIRIHTPHIEVEQDRLQTAGIEVTALQEAFWGLQFGQTVRYFEARDLNGNILQLYEDHVGEIKGFTVKREI